MNTNVRTHLRKKRHGKSIVWKHNRRVIGRRAINPFMKKKIQEGLSKKQVYYASNDNLLNSARNLFDRGEINLEEMGEIERRARFARTGEEFASKMEKTFPGSSKAYYEALESHKPKIGGRYEVVEGPNGRPSGIRRKW